MVPNGESVKLDFEDFYIEPNTGYRTHFSLIIIHSYYPLSYSWYIVLYTPNLFTLFSLRCSYDYLEVRDGVSSNADLIAKLCGNTKPSTQHSTASAMYLRFRTDGSITHKGFKAKYSIGNKSLHLLVCRHVQISIFVTPFS